MQRSKNQRQLGAGEAENNKGMSNRKTSHFLARMIAVPFLCQMMPDAPQYFFFNTRNLGLGNAYFRRYFRLRPPFQRSVPPDLPFPLEEWINLPRVISSTHKSAHRLVADNIYNINRIRGIGKTDHVKQAH